MSKSTEELIRELEAGGILGAPASKPLVEAPAKPAVRSRRRLGSTTVALLLAAVFLVALIGSLPFGSLALYPFALFVTLLHECSHAVAAVVTGGSVDSLQLDSNRAGQTLIAGGIQPIVASAGYVGASLAGAALLLAPLRQARRVLAVLTAVPLAALAFFHPADPFTAIWCAVFAAALAAAAWKLPERLAAFLQIFLGVEVGLNAFRDLMVLLFLSSADSHMQTDATNMSHSLFLPPTFWAILWTVLSVVLLVGALYKVVRRDVTMLRG